MTSGEPLLSPVVRRRLARLGLAPAQAGPGSGLGGRITPADVPDDGRGGAGTGAVALTSSGDVPVGPAMTVGALLDRARRRAADLVAMAQLTSATELDVTSAVGPARSHGAPHDRTVVDRSVLAAVVAAIHAAIRAHPAAAATAGPDLEALLVPDAIDVGLVTPDPRGGERRLLLPDPGEGGWGHDELLALLDAPGGAEVGPSVPLTAPVVVHDRSASDVILETTLLERPAALAFCVGAVGRRVRTVGGTDVGVRWTAMLSVTYDHRVVDGADAARLLATVRAAVAERR